MRIPLTLGGFNKYRFRIIVEQLMLEVEVEILQYLHKCHVLLFTVHEISLAIGVPDDPGSYEGHMYPKTLPYIPYNRRTLRNAKWHRARLYRLMNKWISTFVEVSSNVQFVWVSDSWHQAIVCQ